MHINKSSFSDATRNGIDDITQPASVGSALNYVDLSGTKHYRVADYRHQSRR